MSKVWVCMENEGRKSEGVSEVQGEAGQQGRDAYIRHSAAKYRHMIVNLLGGECELCGDTANLHIHHRDGNHNNDCADNLQLLCRRCHGNIHVGIHLFFADGPPMSKEDKNLCKEIVANLKAGSSKRTPIPKPDHSSRTYTRQIIVRYEGPPISDPERNKLIHAIMDEAKNKPQWAMRRQMTLRRAGIKVRMATLPDE